jgi:hypothetical protein
VCARVFKTFRFLDLDVRCRLVVSFTLRLLYPNKKSPGTCWITVCVGSEAASLQVVAWRRNSVSAGDRIPVF